MLDLFQQTPQYIGRTCQVKRFWAPGVCVRARMGSRFDGSKPPRVVTPILSARRHDAPQGAKRVSGGKGIRSVSYPALAVT